MLFENSHGVSCKKAQSDRLSARLLGFFGELQQSTNTTGDGILGNRRIGQTSQLFQRRIRMIETELARGLEVIGNIVAEDLKCLTHLIACFRGRLGAAAHVGVVEVGQTVRFAPCFAVGTLSSPFAC